MFLSLFCSEMLEESIASIVISRCDKEQAEGRKGNGKQMFDCLLWVMG
jgi:hypothetical protein